MSVSFSDSFREGTILDSYRMARLLENELHILPVVTGTFATAFALFETPICLPSCLSSFKSSLSDPSELNESEEVYEWSVIFVAF